MYEHFFQLRQKPFELVPNPEFLYRSESIRKALAYLEYGLMERTGFILLTGGAGSGKTTLIRNFTRMLNGSITLAQVFNTNVTSEQLIAMINEDFGLDSSGKNKVQLLKDLYQFLIAEYGKGNNALVIIDEAQNLGPELLEEVRMLSNLETDSAKLLQIILVGQTYMRKRLATHELQQLRQRISVVCHLSPLMRAETEEYILHRLEVAGNREAIRFSPEAMDIIHDFSGGVPRLINIICNFILLTACTEQAKEAGAEMVEDIVRELGLAALPLEGGESAAGKRALLQALELPAPPSE